MYLLKTDNLIYLLLCLSLVLFPINYAFFEAIRPVDITILLMLILLFITNKARVSQIHVFLFFAFFSSLLLSTILGLENNPEINIARVFFIYKYSLVFMIPLVVSSIELDKKRYRFILKLLLWTFVFLALWVYGYLILTTMGFITGSFRPSYPLSNSYQISDAHLYSSYLGMFGLVYTIYLSKYFEHSTLTRITVLGISLPALILTGSRTGIAVYLLGMLIFSLFYLESTLRTILKNIMNLKGVVILAALTCIIVYILATVDTSFYVDLLNRAFTFNFAEDESAMGRIRKFRIAFEDAQTGFYILGAGLWSASLIWYDGGIANLLAYTGILGIIALFGYLISLELKLRNQVKIQVEKHLFKIFTISLIVYIASNLITEYYLVTRNVYPIVVFLSLIYSYCHKNDNFDHQMETAV